MTRVIPSAARDLLGNTMRRTTIAALLLSSAASYADDKVEPPPPPSAQLHLIAGTSGVSAASWLYGFKSEACEEKDDDARLASFNLLTRGKKTVSVGVGQRLYVLAVAKIEPPVGADNVGKTECRAMASFVPEDKRAYEIVHDLKARKCPLIIKDAATGTEVSGAQKHKPAGKCKDV